MQVKNERNALDILACIAEKNPNSKATQWVDRFHGERFFEMLDIEEAAAWARNGGIAVHRGLDVTGMEIGRRVRKGQAYHVMALDRDTLVAWGNRNGQRAAWLQPPKAEDAHGLFAGIWHYDVFGGPARKMEARLDIPELESARGAGDDG